MQVSLAGSNVPDAQSIPVKAKPVATPNSSLQFETKYFDSYPRPTSIGSDGAVYGALGGTKTGKVFRTTDAFGGATAGEEGYDFSLEASPNSVVFATKLGSRFIVVTRDMAAMTGSIWTSTIFTSGFTRVVNITGGIPDTIGISWHHGVLVKERVMLVGEYGQTGTQKKLHATFDAGATWSVIKQTTVINAAQNSHFHHSVYDPQRGRVWASQGDGDNARLSYSDDLGVTWKDVPVAPNNYGIDRHQPTLLVPIGKKLFMAPDTNNINPSVLSIPLDSKHRTLNSETFGLEWEHTVWDQEYCFLQYGQPPYVLKDNEAYIMFPNFNGKKKSFIVATGDGGTTWHTVFTGTGMNQLSSGIVGPDTAGFLYAYIVDGDSNPKVMKITRLGWQYS